MGLATGVCKNCGPQSPGKFNKAGRCRECANKSARKCNNANKEKRAAINESWKIRNPKAWSVIQKRHRLTHVDRFHAREHEYRAKIKDKLLEHYGRSCECCGEDGQEFLCFDHIDGDGAAQRKKVGNGTVFYRWLLKHLPDRIRTLCHNCNHCIWAYGRCAHKGSPTKTGGLRYGSRKSARERLRREILQHYSGSQPKCACCPIEQIEFLTIDHIQGGGKKHQKEVGRYGSDFYKWIVENDFPPIFQVLCYNCNHAKGRKDKCPHQG